MSKTSKIVTTIIVVIVIVAAICWYVYLPPQQSTSLIPTQPNVATNNVNVQNTGNVSATNPKDTSDAAINSDLSSIDSQMESLNTDSNNLNQSLTNQ